MRPPKILASKHNIAVVGLYRSGKTVFITSFINHLMHHRPRGLKIGDGRVQVIFDEELSPRNGFDRFPYEQFRCDNEGRWPLKTKATSQYRCTFFRSDWRWTKGELSLIDIPGERMSDIPIAKRSYSQWSDELLQKIFRDSHYQDAAREYEASLTCPAADEDSVIAAYRQLLAELYRSFRPIITPSTFLVTVDGRFNGTAIMRGDHSGAFCGLTEQSQFAPLPPPVREKRPELAEAFDARYVEYRNKLAVPIFDSLARCNELVVLVDVTTLLAANTGMYNGNRALLDRLFNAVAPGKGFLGTMFDLLRKPLGGYFGAKNISKIAVVATKADKVHDSQRDKLRELTREMADSIVERQRQRTSNLESRYFACAAVKSTFSVPGAGCKLRGCVTGENGPVEYSSSELPERWPGSWRQGDYVFPDVAPIFPENAAVTPDHLGMDSLIEFLLTPRR